MEFFGITYYGPQNYLEDMLRKEYHEPMNADEANDIMNKVLQNTTCPKEFTRPDITLRTIDCYLGRVNGFAYGSSQRYNKMKRKGIMKPMSPVDMYRLPPTTYMDIGWFLCDPDLVGETWYKTIPRYPQPMSPNTIILDKAKKNNKYATLF